MEPTTLLAFTVALTIAAMVPGPGMTALVARALAVGFWGTVPMIFGMIAGDLVFLSCAALGMAALAATFATVFTVVKFAGAAYLLWLGWQLWTAPAHTDAVAATRAPSHSPGRVFLGGLTLTLGNPKTIIFYMALLPTVVDLTSLTPLGFVELVAIVFVDLTVVGAAYAALAARARDFFRDASARRILDRTAGAMMAGAAVAVATR
ncbi:LysE family translocator [Pinisolibacter aquiterrae]|uniref:LysE family translocator n=1 Tax=Pinisolibacter aquiterrae TaxID=2815579 RepID=UPI001C3C9E5A|nr:LysE family translocator [Pinisolibacter aquiterrae]MBV5263753.1 LysE family translocator [Pinisolibacter aquiterrae]MCC8235048.1 LysE family translocator [Pinisolibacter aquiterrae]